MLLFFYQAIWQHPSALALLICSSAFWLTFFLQDFLTEFILGLVHSPLANGLFLEIF